MKKRELLVFAGQSNMMGACALPPKTPIVCQNAFEYKHKMRRLTGTGEFVPSAHPAGEFSYVDLAAAYAEDMTTPDGKSRLNNYVKNTYFCPAMYNAADENEKTLRAFAEFSEADDRAGVSIAPILAMEWEKRGGASAYTHVAKGGVSILHYFTDEMLCEYRTRMQAYNTAHGTSFKTEFPKAVQQTGAGEYFAQKVADFLAEAPVRFPNEDLSDKILVWIQGESDARMEAEEYLLLLEIFWERAKALGLTHFFMLRVDFWDDPNIRAVMCAQEQFCQKHDDCYMMTRFLSYIIYPKGYPSELYVRLPEEYRNCRDTAYGFGNPHINERGFLIAAQRVADNMVRVLREGLDPLPEEELVIGV